MYGRQSSGRGLADFFARGSTPLTISLIVANVVTFLLIAAAPQLGLGRLLAFRTDLWPMYFWTILTWPLTAVGESPIGLLFAAGWTYLFLGGLERAWGTRATTTFLVAVSALSALTLYLGSFIAGAGMLAGLWIAVGPAAVAWAILNSRETMAFFFLPLPAWVFGALGAVTVWFYAGAAYGNPLLGVFALSGCAAAYWYARHGQERFSGGLGTTTRSGFRVVNGGAGGGASETSSRFRNFDRESGRSNPLDRLNPLRWWNARTQKRRVEDMLRRSGFSDNDADKKQR